MRSEISRIHHFTFASDYRNANIIPSRDDITIELLDKVSTFIFQLDGKGLVTNNFCISILYKMPSLLVGISYLP